MSIWTQVRDLSESGRHEIYQVFKLSFPEQVRAYIGHSLDQDTWSNFYQNNQVSHETSSQFIRNAMRDLDHKLAKQDTFAEFVANSELRDSIKHVQGTYLNDPVPLIGLVQNFINFVRATIAKHKANTNQQQQTQPDELDELHATIKEMAMMAKSTKLGLQQVQDVQQNFVDNYQKYNQVNLQQLQAEFFQAKAQLVQDMSQRYKVIISRLQMMPAQFDKVLAKWRRAYQLSLINYPFANNLDTIQALFESVVDLILTVRNEISTLLELNRSVQIGNGEQQMNLEQDALRLDQILATLLKISFVIEEQPTFFKKEAVFRLSGRFLFGKQLANQAMVANIRVKLVNSEQARQISLNNVYPKMSAISPNEPMIMNNTANMSFSSGTSRIELANMTLTRFTRKPEETQYVVEKRYFLMVLGQISYNCHTGPVEWGCLSSPISILTHANQIPAAWAVMTWSYAFQQQGDLHSVPFRKLGKVLSDKFKNAFGRGFTQHNLKFIASKLTQDYQADNWLDQPVHWPSFARDGGNRKTFWDWFYQAFEFSKNHLAELWKDGLIMGFVSKKDAEQILAKSPPGTFILRFSESDHGGISVAWFDEDKGQLMNLRPFKADNLKDKGLADHLRDLDHLSMIYLNENNIVTKDHVFENHYQPEINEGSNEGSYVRPVSKTIVPGYTNKNLPGSTRSDSMVSSYQDSYQGSPQATGLLRHLSIASDGIDIDDLLVDHPDSRGFNPIEVDDLDKILDSPI